MKFFRVARTFGTIFRTYAVFLLVPLVGSLYWDDAVPSANFGVPMKLTTASFLLTFLFVFLLGLLLTSLAHRFDESLREREAFFIVGAGWLFCAALGAIPFLLTGATRDPLAALYESMSSITATGLTALQAPLEQYAPSIHLWRATNHFFGGLGIILIIYAVIGRLVEGGSRLMGTELGGDVARLRPKLTQTAKSLFGIYLGLNAAAFLALWPAMHFTGLQLSWKTAAYHALVHAMGSIATGGTSSLTASVAGFHSTLVSTIVYLAILAGSISFVLYFQAFHGEGLSAIWRNSEFRFYLTVLLLASTVVAAVLFFHDLGTGFSVGHGAFLVMSTMATSGYTTTSAEPLPDVVKLVLVLCMLTGGLVGSTSGALKIARIQMLFRLTYRELERLIHPHAVSIVKVGGRVIPDDSMRRIVVFFFMYTTAFMAGAVAFGFLGFTLSDSLVASGANLGGVGLGWGRAAAFADPAEAGARILGILLMWLGRLEIFTVLLLFAPATYRD